MHDGVDHLAEEVLEVGRFGGGARGLHQAVADAVLDGAQDAHGAARRPQHRVDEVGGGGLAVRARDPHELEAIGGPAEHGRREDGQGLARVRDLRARARRARPGLRRRRPSGALLPRRFHERVPVLGEALDGHEERSRRDAARIVGDVGDRKPSVAREHGPGTRARQVAQVHGRASPAGAGASRSWERRSTQFCPGSISAPAGGVCSTTRPDPRSSTIRPRRAAAMAASRADCPRRSGMTRGSPFVGRPRACARRRQTRPLRPPRAGRPRARRPRAGAGCA